MDKFFLHPKCSDKGCLISLESYVNVPFNIKRVYYIYGVPKGIRRGFHSHKNLKQILICVSGAVKIYLEHDNVKKIVTLDSPDQGLYISANVWREMFDFNHKTVLMVLASEKYDEDDYIRDYDHFQKVGNKK